MLSTRDKRVLILLLLALGVVLLGGFTACQTYSGAQEIKNLKRDIADLGRKNSELREVYASLHADVSLNMSNKRLRKLQQEHLDDVRPPQGSLSLSEIPLLSSDSTHAAIRIE